MNGRIRTEAPISILGGRSEALAVSEQCLEAPTYDISGGHFVSNWTGTNSRVLKGESIFRYLEPRSHNIGFHLLCSLWHYLPSECRLFCREGHTQEPGFQNFILCDCDDSYSTEVLLSAGLAFRIWEFREWFTWFNVRSQDSFEVIPVALQLSLFRKWAWFRSLARWWKYKFVRFSSSSLLWLDCVFWTPYLCKRG